jgi:preprotein translocase subunit SecY
MAGAEGIVKIPELRKRILLTLTLLAVYRIGVHIPTPGVDGAALAQFFQNTKGTIFSWFNLFSGGALERFSVLALGVMPYISASIIFQLLTVVWPYLHELQKEGGEQGRKKINQYTRYATVVLCLIQGYGIAAGLEQMSNPQVVLTPGLSFRLMTMLTLCAGTVFLMWLGEQITERGIGNGVSLIIFAGIAARIPTGISNTISLLRSGELSFMTLLFVIALIIATFAFIIFMERAQRRIPVHYAKRIIGRRMYGGQNTHLPLKINVSGVIPPIFASSLIMFPATIATFVKTDFMQKISSSLSPGGMLHDVLYVLLIIFFTFFYTAVTFKTDDIAESLKKNGGFIPGIRPGQKTAEYIDFVLSRITVGGAIYISLICIMPTILAQKAKVPFYFGGTSVLILVGVALDTVAQIESFLLTRNYEGFVKGAQIRSRRV